MCASRATPWPKSSARVRGWREPMETGFSLGSNLGDRLLQLATARDRICALPGVRPLATSPVYETDPVGVRPEYRHLPFLNAVLIVESARSPAEWRHLTSQIETSLAACARR